MKEEKIRRFLSMAVIVGGIAIVIICTVYQNHFYRVPHKVYIYQAITMLLILRQNMILVLKKKIKIMIR